MNDKAESSAAAVVPANGSVSVFAPVTASILHFVDPVEMARAFKEQVRFDIEIIAKQLEALPPRTVLYSASIDKTLLKFLFYMVKFDKIAPAAAAFA